MKKIFSMLALSAWLGMAQAQIVDGKNIGEMTEVQYVEIKGVSQGLFKKKIVVIVDYGQKINAFETDARVQGPDGKAVVFNSMMDALNQFSGWGWELVTTYFISEGSSGSVINYVLRKKSK